MTKIIARVLILFGGICAIPCWSQVSSELVEFSKQDVRRISIESAIEIVDSYIGSDWLVNRDVERCTKGGLGQSSDMQVQLSWLSGLIEFKAAGTSYLIEFKSNEWRCLKAINTPIADGGVELAGALWRLTIEDSDAAIRSFYDKRRQSLAGASAVDRLLEMARDYDEAVPLLEDFAEEAASGVVGGDSSYEIPSVAVSGFIAQTNSKLSNGDKHVINFGTELSEVSESGSVLTIKYTQKMPTREYNSESDIQTAQYELPVGNKLLTNDKERRFKFGTREKETVNRHDIHRSGQAGFFPARLGVPIRFEQRYVEDTSIVPGLAVRQQRVCVPVAEERLSFGGEEHPVLKFECVAIFASRFKTSNGTVFNQFNRSSEQLWVSIRHGIPLVSEEISVNHSSGTEGRRVNEYRVTVILGG